jgi:hypothetical protein
MGVRVVQEDGPMDRPRQAPAQTYESTIYDRDSGRAFTFVVVPSRSVAGREFESLHDAATRLGFAVLPEGVAARGGPPPLRPVPSYALPFAIEYTFVSPTDYGDQLRWSLGMSDSRIYARDEPSQFAQYLAFSPVVPVESSPLSSKSLGDLAAAGGGLGGALGAYVTGDPLLLLTIPTGIIVCGAARGISQALEVGLRSKLLDLMNVEDPNAPRDEPPPVKDDGG